MQPGSIEISVKGKWVRVPALEIDEKTIVVRGTWIKVARIHDEWWMESEIEDAGVLVDALKQQGSHGLHADIFTFTQKVPGSPVRYNYLTELESVAAIRISNSEDWWKSLPQETRKNVRRSQKRGVTTSIRVFDDDLIKGIIEVNNDSPMRQGQANAYYGQSLDQARKDYSGLLDRSEFICANVENEMIGFLKLVYKGEVAAILNLTVKVSHNDKRPANALIAKAVELCEKRGASYLTYGLFNYANKGDNPLREFKIRNGFKEVLTPRYYVPLTMWGIIAIKLGFHRGLLGILPHNLITVGLNLRTRWYSLKRSSKAGVAQC
jgi:hypothetical protein